MSRTFNATATLAMAKEGKLSVKELRQAVNTARDFAKTLAKNGPRPDTQ